MTDTTDTPLHLPPGLLRVDLLIEVVQATSMLSLLSWLHEKVQAMKFIQVCFC